MPACHKCDELDILLKSARLCDMLEQAYEDGKVHHGMVHKFAEECARYAFPDVCPDDVALIAKVATSAVLAAKI